MATRAVSPVSIDEVCSFIKYLEERSNRFGCLNEQYLELQARFSKQEKDYTTVARELEEVKEQKQHQEDVITILEGECVELREQNQQIQKEALTKDKQYEKNLQVMAATIGSLKDQNAKMNMEQMQLSSYMNVILDDMETREQEIETICKETDIERELKDACCEHMSQVLRVKKDLIAQNLAYKSKIALLGCLLKETTRKCTDLASQFRSLQERIFKKNKSKRCERNTEEDPVMAEIECVEMKWTSQYRQTMEILHSVHVDFLPHESDDDDYASEFEEYAAGLDKQTGDASRTPKKPSKPDGNAQSLAACASGGQRLDDDSKGARAKTAAYKKGRGGGKGKKKKQQKGNRNNNYSTKRSESPEEEIDPFADVERVPKLPPECYVPPACPTDLDVTTAFRRMTIKDIKRIREKYLRKEF